MEVRGRGQMFAKGVEVTAVEWFELSRAGGFLRTTAPSGQLNCVSPTVRNLLLADPEGDFETAVDCAQIGFRETAHCFGAAQRPSTRRLPMAEGCGLRPKLRC